MRAIVADAAGDVPEAAELKQFIIITRERCLTLGTDLSWEERGALLELLGSAERAFFLIERIRTERRSVPRVATSATEQKTPPLDSVNLAPVSG